MMKIKSTWCGLVIVMLFATCTNAYGGIISVSTQYNGHSSDYYYHTDWSAIPGGNYDCGTDNITLQAGTNNYGNTDIYNHDITNNTTGSLNTPEGPGMSKAIYFRVYRSGTNYNGGCITCSGGCTNSGNVHVEDITWGPSNSQTVTLSTDDIHSPVGVSASIVYTASFQLANISWSKGSDIPDSLIGYKVYRNGNLIATLPASTFSYTDSTLLPTSTYTYSVTTYTTRWNGHESQLYNSEVNIYLANTVLSATDGTFYGKSQLTWPNIASYAPNGIEITRNGLQLNVANKNATTYNDYDGVPGVVYTYLIAPIDNNNNTPFSFTDNGNSRPNGIIKGNVATIYNAAVSGVTLDAYATVDGNIFILDSTVTDASGFYQFGDLFYDTSAVYTIVPHKGSHTFNPDTLTRILSLNNNVASGVNFTDTSVFTIKGAITFTADPHCAAGGCHPVGVTIYNNGVPTAGVTDANGQFSFAIQQEGTYTFKPVASGHKFSPDSIVIHVTSDSFGVNFTDITTDTLFISLQGGCHNQVAHHAQVSIADNNGHYLYSPDYIRNNASGTVSQFLILPAQPYTVTLIGAYSSPTAPDPTINAAFSSPIPVDLTTRDSATLSHIDTTITLIPAIRDTLLNGMINIIPAHRDTTTDTLRSRVQVEHRADFIYHGVVHVDVVDYPFSTICPSVNNGYILDQGNNTNLWVTINEFYPYDSTTCPVDSGQLVIYDDVSDIGNAQTVNFYNGIYKYTVVPGSPNIASPYLKLLQFFAHVGNSTANWGKQILVTGHKPHTQTFVTKTPELPFFVLHDPPGNASYSFLAKDSTATYNYSSSYQYGGSSGPYIDAKIGAGVPIPFTGITIGAGAEVSADVTAGANNTNNSSLTTTFTAHQQVSTSNTSDYVGAEGDVIVGGSFNMIYALTDVIELKNCTVVRDTQLAWGANGLATNYIYTVKHIRETLLPQLQLLKSLSHGDTVQLIQSYIDVWNQVLQKNARNRDTTSTFVQNVSFSAGAPYDNTSASGVDSNVSYNYNVFVNADLGLGVFFGDISGFANTTIGVKTNFQWNSNKSNSTDINTVKTIGYHLEDDNVGNFYSVDVKTDHVYGTPAFGIVAGTSACPHEAGTQARDSVDLFLDNYAVANVPINQTANYTAHIVNLSESQETRTYSIQAVAESNPQGAIISIGGQQINNSPANFTVAAGTDLPVILTVGAGPIAADYNGLKVSAYSPCDGGEGNTITFEAHFQSTCSPIGIYTPSDNWLVNAASNDSLLVIFSGYNANDSNLISIGLEYRQPGGTWLPATNPPIPTSALTSPYYNFLFHTNSLADGAYELRAYANCGSQPGGRTYSSTLSGTIDRSSLSLFGTPTPADGVLNINQNISVSFNGQVNCNQAAAYTPIYSTLVRNDNGQVIPDSVTCNNNQLIIYTNPPSLIDSLENVTLTATINNVYDINGNSLQQPIIWSFMVSRSKVYWNPSNLNISSVTGISITANAIMYNTGPLDSFTLVHVPSWLTTPQSLSYLISNGTPANPSQLSIPFTVSNALNPGTYRDTVVALASGKMVYLFINLDVVKPHPNWTVNPASFQYTMNVTTNYSLTQLNAPLSTDTRDTIAVFKGEECRGYAGISYDPYSNKYVAFLTAYSNSAVGDTFTFRIWDAVPGTEYQAKERLAFVNNGTIGQPLAPYILHPEGVFETVTMTPGWNWFSLNVRSTDMSPKNVLSHLHPVAGTVVKTDKVYAQYVNPATGWTGPLTAFSTNYSYMIQLPQADTLRLLGQPVTDTSVISIASGWNWIGFPRQNISDAGSFLRNVNVSNGDLLKSESQFTQYSGGNWSGSLHNMYPGEGYKLNTANAFNFVIPPDRSLPSWNVDQNRFQQNQNVTADLQFNGSSTTQSHYLVGAFANGICVGTAQPQFLTSLNLYRVFITIHGDTANATQPLTFKVYDTDNDIEYVPTYIPISVTPDTVIAQVTNAYVINVQTATGINALNYTDGFSLLQNAPNPFAKTTSIDYTIPSAQQVTVTIYDESGRLIRELVNGTQAAGTHKISFEQDNLQSGVYFYQMKAGEFTKTRRMMIIQ
jgi:hypothetical protein